MNSALSGQQRRAIGAALAAVFLGALDLTVITTILPQMVVDLRINTADVDRYVWIVNSYLLAYIIAIPVFGRISDLLGRTAAFHGSLALFAIGSLACALANDLPTMVIGRAIQGAGGGALLPVTMALVSDFRSAGKRTATLGLVGAIDTLGWVLGPMWGALLVGLGPGPEPWRWAFYVNVPLAVLAALAIARVGGRRAAIPRDWHAKLDIPGIFFAAAALLVINLGLSAGGELGGAVEGGRALGGSRNPLAAFAVPLVILALVFTVLLVRRQRNARWPLFPVKLFRDQRFSAAIVANFLVGASLIVAMVDIPVITALIVDTASASRTAALALAPFTMCLAIFSFIGGRLAARSDPRRFASLGFLLVAIGYVGLWFGLRNGHMLGSVPGLLVAGAGFGLSFAPISATAIDAAASADRGIASAMTLVFRLLGMTISISMLTAIAVRRLQGLVGDLAMIVQAPGESTSDFLARQTTMLYETVIPVSLQVARETFLLAAVIALLGLIPAALLTARSRT